MTAPFEKARTLRDVRRQAQLGPLDATDERYVPLHAVRGEHVIKRFSRLLDDDASYVHLAYAGHRGSGKTTELFRLMQEVQEDTFCAYFDAHPDLNMGDLEYTDVLLYIAQKVLERALNEVSLDESVLKAVEDYFVEVTEIDKKEIKKEVKLEAKASAGVKFPFLFDVLASLVARIGGSQTYAKDYRTRLQKRPDQLINNVNLLLDHVAERLKSKNKNRLLLILDSLDRLQSSTLEKGVLKDARVFTQLRINLILTVPLAAIYLPEGETLESMGMKTVILPMVAVRGKEQSWTEMNEEHVAKLSEMITKRIDVGAVFADARTIREIVLLSGGSFREMFDLVAEAAMEAEELPITAGHYEVAARRVWNAFKAPLSFADRESLVTIHREKAVDRQKEVFRLLFHRFALEYNGTNWADVHPLIMRFDERFKKLLAEQ